MKDFMNKDLLALTFVSVVAIVAIFGIFTISFGNSNDLPANMQVLDENIVGQAINVGDSISSENKCCARCSRGSECIDINHCGELDTVCPQDKYRFSRTCIGGWSCFD